MNPYKNDIKAMTMYHVPIYENFGCIAFLLTNSLHIRGFD